MDKVFKYIIIPEGKRLWAMQRIYGPTTGPLARPVKVPLDVVHDLIVQCPPEDITVYEVKPVEFNQNGQPTRFDKAVRLTKDNYAMSYDEIAGKAPIPPKDTMKKVEPEKKAVAPVIVEKKEEEKKVAKKPIEGKTIVATVISTNEGNTVKSETVEAPVPTTLTSGYIAPVEEAVAVPAEVTTTTAPAEPVEETPEEQVERAEDTATVSNGDPWEGITDEEREAYAKMSKSERKAARKAHRNKTAEE